MSIGKAKDIHNTKIIGIQKSGTIIEASHLMNKHGYSQLIVYEDNIITGSISEEKKIYFLAYSAQELQIGQYSIEMVSPNGSRKD